MKYFSKCILFVALLAAGTSCAAKRTSLSVMESTERWAIFEGDTPLGFFVIVKSGRDLDQSLSRLHCEKQPCMVDRLGEVYLVERPGLEPPAGVVTTIP